MRQLLKSLQASSSIYYIENPPNPLYRSEDNAEQSNIKFKSLFAKATAPPPMEKGEFKSNKILKIKVMDKEKRHNPYQYLQGNAND